MPDGKRKLHIVEDWLDGDDKQGWIDEGFVAIEAMLWKHHRYWMHLRDTHDDSLEI